MEPDGSLRDNVILIVDDDANTVATLEQAIGDAFGCRVITAPSGDDALSTIDSGVHVDLVFSDVLMPNIDGIELAREIGKRRSGLPVVLTTGRPDMFDWILRQGGVALIKPYSMERLRAVFAEQLCKPISRAQIRDSALSNR